MIRAGSVRGEGPFEGVTPERLRQRRSAKWVEHPSDVLPAWIAEMDVAVPPAVRAALHAAVDRDDFGYVHARTVPLGELWSAFCAERFGWSPDPARVSLVPDVMQGAAEVLRLVTEPGDGIVINPPVYPPFFSTIENIERTVVEVPLAHSADGWALDLDALEAAFAAGARAYLLCNPHNPVGRAFTRDELAEVATLAGRYGVPVVSDEIHAPLCFPGTPHTPWASLGGAAADTGVSVLSASKAFNLAGLKCAVVVAGSARAQRLVERIPEEVQYGASILGAIATDAALREGGPWLDELVAALASNVDLLGRLLDEHLPAVRWTPPSASYLAWLDCSGLGIGDDPAAVFSEHGRVALSAGHDFGAPGAGYARLNLATTPELLTEAVQRMAAAVSSADAAPPAVTRG